MVKFIGYLIAAIFIMFTIATTLQYWWIIAFGAIAYFLFTSLKEEKQTFKSTPTNQPTNNQKEEIKQLKQQIKTQHQINNLQQTNKKTSTTLLDTPTPIKEEELKNRLNYVDIKKRRPYNNESFQIEKQIAAILSHKKDEKGKTLVKLIIRIFEKMGYIAKNNDGFDDDKKDILIHEKNQSKPCIVIQCKSYSPQSNGNRIGQNDIAQFMGSSEKFGKNRIYITSSYFHKKAIDRYSNDIILIDRIGLIHLLYKYFPLETMNVLNSSSLHEIEKTCEKCGHGKLQLMFYDNHPSQYKCTNCGSTFSFKNDNPYKFKEWEMY